MNNETTYKMTINQDMVNLMSNNYGGQSDPLYRVMSNAAVNAVRFAPRTLTLTEIEIDALYNMAEDILEDSDAMDWDRQTARDILANMPKAYLDVIQ